MGPQLEISMGLGGGSRLTCFHPPWHTHSPHLSRAFLPTTQALAKTVSPGSHHSASCPLPTSQRSCMPHPSPLLRSTFLSWRQEREKATGQ